MNYSDLSSFPWIVSSGTLKREDLLVSFWQALESLPSPSSDSFSFWISPSILSSLEKLVGEDSKEEDYKEEEASELLASLFELLCKASPSGFYFGSHEGDGALFGFWLCDEWESALQNCDFFSEDAALCASAIEAAEGFDVDPDTFSDCFYGEVSAYTEAEAEAEAAKELLREKEEKLPRFFDLLDFGKVWHHLYSSDFAVAKSSQSASYFLFDLSRV